MRRQVALLVHLLLLQFLLLGAGDACVLSAVAGGLRPAVTQAAAVPGAMMDGMPDAVAPGAQATIVQDRARAGAHDPSSCAPAAPSAPHTPTGTGCQTLAPCASAARPAEPPLVVASAPTRAAAEAPAYVVRRLTSRIAAPEPPPPRA